MVQEPVTQFFQNIKQDEALQAKSKAAPDLETCVKLGRDHGYHFSPEELQAGLSELSEEEQAEIINPGIAPRRHLYPH